MIKKPNKCAKVGTYDCQIYMSIAGRVRGVDLCISDIVASLNAANIKTVASCCGHKIMPGSIVLDDGRHIVIYPDLKSGNNAIKQYIKENDKK